MQPTCYILRNDQGHIVCAGQMVHLQDFMIAGNNYRTSRFFTVCDFNNQEIKTFISRG